MSSERNGGPDRRVVWVLVVLPLWLVVSTLGGLWFWRKSEDAQHEPAKFATPISEESVRGELATILERVGPRHTASEAGRKGLRRMAAMIEGTLGPDNAGYRLERLIAPAVDGGEAWPVIVAGLPHGSGPGVWVVAAYDQDPAGGGVEANATGVATVLSVAQALAGDKTTRPLSFVFLPHGYDREAPLGGVIELLRLKGLEIERLLVVEAMGVDDQLLVSSRSSEAMAHMALETYASIVGPEVICFNDDEDLSSVFFEAGFPAVRVSTGPVVRHNDGDREIPDAAVHARATRALAGMVRALVAD